MNICVDCCSKLQKLFQNNLIVGRVQLRFADDTKKPCYMCEKEKKVIFQLVEVEEEDG